MHRNAEIWSNRLARLEAIGRNAARNYRVAMQGAKLQGTEQQCETNYGRWVLRYLNIEQRVWKALCTAKGWR